MGKHTAPSPELNIFTEAVVQALVDQSWFIRRKDTIITVTTGLVWLIGLVGPLAGDWPAWIGVALGVVATVAGALTNALTRGAITPSMASRLESSVIDANLMAGHPGEVADAH